MSTVATTNMVGWKWLDEEKKHGEAFLELTGDSIGFPFLFRGFPFIVHMKPYRAQAFKDMMRESGFRWVNRDGAVDLVAKDNAAIIDFFWAHFAHLTDLVKPDGVHCTPVEAAQWIKDNPRLGIPTETVDGGIAGMAEDRNGNRPFDPWAKDETITLKQPLVWVPELDRSEPLHVAHRFRAATALEARRFAQAHESTRFVKDRTEYSNLRNYDTVEQLYNALVTGLDNAFLGGTPCTEANKEGRDGWVDLVPFYQKDTALRGYFAGATLKNE